MLGHKSFELIKQLNSSLLSTSSCGANGELSAYNEDNIRSAIDECHLLFGQNSVDVQPVLNGDNSNLSTITMRHAALQRNKRCLLTYAYTRMNWIASLRFELGTAQLPRSITSKMSEQERRWFTAYSSTLAKYMKAVSSGHNDIDLTQYMHPPKSLYLHVRCLQDHGEFELADGQVILLAKNSQHYVQASDVQNLIRQGILEHID